MGYVFTTICHRTNPTKKTTWTKSDQKISKHIQQSPKILPTNFNNCMKLTLKHLPKTMQTSPHTSSNNPLKSNLKRLNIQKTWPTNRDSFSIQYCNKTHDFAWGTFLLKQLGLDEGITPWDPRNRIPRKQYLGTNSEDYRSESRSKYLKPYVVISMFRLVLASVLFYWFTGLSLYSLTGGTILKSITVKT